MRILITNDDGINAPGIRALADFAKGFGEVTVIAPKVEQSGKSQAIDFVSPIEIVEADIGIGVRAFSVDSTPADCVRFGLDGLKEQFDLVLSGINRGVNLGADIVYSGTVGAIFEAARQGVPGIAVSTYPDTLAEAELELERVFGFIKENRLLDKAMLYNVNIPPSPKGIRITKQGSPYFSDEFRRLDEKTYLQMGSMLPDTDPSDTDRDTVSLGAGYISITPLSVNRTDMRAFSELERLSFDF